MPTRTPRHLSPLLVSFVCALALPACESEDGANHSEVLDRDQDGLSTADGDCDDRNDTIHPGAKDVPGDGIDQDCAGGDEPAPPPPPPSDVDGDGTTTEDGDCDDKNSAVHPGARERSGDGVDSNCDGDELPKLGEDVFSKALGIIDTDKDGAISFEEFDAACAASAMVVGKAEPGVVMTHASCAGTNACRGMILHPWGELLEHDCAGVNHCTGWSCVETLPDKGRDAETLFEEVGCNNCHSGDGGAFIVYAPPLADAAMAATEFKSRSDERLRSAIAFGIRGTSPGDVAYQNMPAHYAKMSRAEMNTMISWLRTTPLQGKNFEWAEEAPPVKK